MPALRAGERYARHAPVVRRLLRRAALFLVPATALWALPPAVASQRLDQGRAAMECCLGALGVGEGVRLAWVRARGLGIYQMVLFWAQVGGAVLWGLLAGPLGLVATVLLAAVVLFASAATLRQWPLLDTQGLDRSRAVYWPEPQLVLEPDPQSDPVVVTSTYTVAPTSEAAFLQAMVHVRLSRLRTGAVQWGLFCDGETAHRFGRPSLWSPGRSTCDSIGSG